MRCDHLHDSAVYVLGALSPPEREAYERHLADCPACREEVADLAVMPGLLSRLDLATAQAVAAGGEDAMSGVIGTLPMDDPERTTRPEPPRLDVSKWAGPTVVPDDGPRDPLLPRILDRATARRRSERRRQRWQTAGAALVAACLGVLAVLGVRAAGVGGPPDLTAMREVAATAPVTAELALESFSGGTKVHMHCAYKSGLTGTARWTYKLVVVPRSGEPEEISSWTAGVGDEYELTGHSRIATADIQRIELRKGDGTPLLVHER